LWKKPPASLFCENAEIAVRPSGRIVAIYLFVVASD